jgi:hypothetical protein
MIKYNKEFKMAVSKEEFQQWIEEGISNKICDIHIIEKGEKNETL